MPVKLSENSTLQPLYRDVLQVETDLDAQPQVLTWFDQFDQDPVPHQVWLPCQLAIVEGFTNAVRHAHQGKPEYGFIDLEVQIFDDRLEIRIWDQGAPFDLHKPLRKMPPLNSDKGHSRGLLLMAKIGDVLKYTREPNGRNCLLLIRQYNAMPKSFLHRWVNQFCSSLGA